MAIWSSWSKVRNAGTKRIFLGQLFSGKGRMTYFETADGMQKALDAYLVGFGSSRLHPGQDVKILMPAKAFSDRAQRLDRRLIPISREAYNCGTFFYYNLRWIAHLDLRGKTNYQVGH